MEDWNAIDKIRDKEKKRKQLDNAPHFVKSIQEDAHQQRLDNVLSKFEDGINKHINWKATDGKFVELYYYEQDNSFNIEHNCEDIIQGLSLETVESLIKDLEATDEK